MTRTSAVHDDAAIAAALRRLRARPPAGFSDRVLARVGLGIGADSYVLADAPAGPLFVAFSAHGISHVLLASTVEWDAERFAEIHLSRFGRQARPVAKPPAGLGAALRTGRSRHLDFDLGACSEFERAVLHKALEIPRGELRPYSWVAREIGRPLAVRAVGSALGRNPVPVLIPCHRVVRSDGRIGEYAFGTAMKRSLLTAEAIDLQAAERLAQSGIHFVGSDSTQIFCFPTCHHAQRITHAHRVLFRRASDAAGSGYRPCAACRPTPVLRAGA